VTASAQLSSEAANSLSKALVLSSRAPVLLLDEALTIQGASRSFCNAFQLDLAKLTGVKLAQVGQGEWDSRQLNALLKATVDGNVMIDGYEMNLVRQGQAPCCLVLNAHKLDYSDIDQIRVVLTVTDITASRLAAKVKDDLARDKEVLLQELQHRVANSLQIIASVLMQSAKRVQSEETRLHLHDAHHRVMSIATLQRQLSTSRVGEVELRPYLHDLCQSIGASMIPDHGKLSLTASVDDSRTDPDTSVSLGLIVTELVINALKHAFPSEHDGGEIAVNYRAHGTEWTMTVSDNGVGMPASAGLGKPGLGTGIVDALSKQLGASVRVTSSSAGTLVSIMHPVINN
jgi:two-component sensor histidine kinase